MLTGGVNTYELVALHGSLKLQNRTPVTDDPASFSLARLNVSRLQNLLSDRLLLLASVKAQYALNNLDSTEQFQLGGPDQVRAFGPGEGTGDSGVVGSLELRFLPPEAWFGRISRELVFSTFYDYGTIRFRHDQTKSLQADSLFENSASLSGAGIGAVWDRPHNFSLRLTLAWPLSGQAVNDTKKSPRVYFVGNKSF
jgi:hemolysin activation/secretion protein